MKASSIENVEELGLSHNIITFARKRCCRWGLSFTENIILSGRIQARNTDKYTARAMNDLVYTLDDLGFIRHDFKLLTFNIGGFYTSLLGGQKPNRPYMNLDGKPLVIREVCDFCSNEEYESFRNVSPEEHAKILSVIDSLLEETSAAIIKYLYGLDGKCPLNTSEIARTMQLTLSAAKCRRDRALKILSNNYALFPKLTDSVNRVDPESMYKKPATPKKSTPRIKRLTDSDRSALEILEKLKTFYRGDAHQKEADYFSDLKRLMSDSNLTPSTALISLVDLHNYIEKTMKTKIDAAIKAFKS
jgi:hypothetical protein